ncbi:hypothetical protein DFH08DRAFT_812557 [Mycena albidolilacea]|uniref:Uncharacterized protein n=1 Tax=Mycena albidolilacea TaxID=1033008 RepID=A0AAD6ZTZ3_9AGAR|nr:hypothetical protein DFH08DRAFT_812557 [Mycena albidolilacea]
MARLGTGPGLRFSTCHLSALALGHQVESGLEARGRQWPMTAAGINSEDKASEDQGKDSKISKVSTARSLRRTVSHFTYTPAYLPQQPHQFYAPPPMVMELRTCKNPHETAGTTKAAKTAKATKSTTAAATKLTTAKSTAGPATKKACNFFYGCGQVLTKKISVEKSTRKGSGRGTSTELSPYIQHSSSLLQKSRTAAERVDEHEQPAETGTEEPVDEQAVTSKDSNKMDMDATPAEDAPVEDAVQDGKMLSKETDAFMYRDIKVLLPQPHNLRQEENSGENLANDPSNDPFSLFKHGPYARTVKPHEVEEEGEVEADDSPLVPPVGNTNHGRSCTLQQGPAPAHSRCHRQVAPIAVVAARSRQGPAPARSLTHAPAHSRCHRRAAPIVVVARSRQGPTPARALILTCAPARSRRTPHADKMHGVRATTLPPSSPLLPIEESELSYSSNNYAEAVAQKQRVKKRTREHGGRVSPGTETEEEENLREHEDMMPAAKSKKGKNSMRAVGPAAHAGHSKSTARSKGKVIPEGGELEGTAVAPATSKCSRQKAKAKDVGEDTDVDVVMYGDVTNDDDEEGEADSGGGSNKKGPIPQAAVDRLNEVYKTFLLSLDEITKDCGKSTHTLHQALGTTIKAACGMCGKVDGTTYTNTARKAFKEALRKASPDFTNKMIQDSAACFAALPWLAEWNEQLVTQAVVDIREAGKLKPRLQKEIKPVLAIAHQLQKEFGVYMLGFVIDPQDHTSFVFGNGDEVKEYRQSQLFNLNQQVKDMDHSFGVIDMRKRGLVTQGAPMKSLVAQSDEGKRDTCNSEVGSRLWRLGDAANAWSRQDTVFSNFRMKWNISFIEAARKSKCRIINYPAALKAGKQVIRTSTFNVKKIQQTTFEKFVPDLVKAQEHGTQDDADVMVIVPWAGDETDLPLEEQGDVGVVLNEEGRVLVYRRRRQRNRPGRRPRSRPRRRRAGRHMEAEEGTYGARKPPAPSPAHHYSRDDGDLEHGYHENGQYEHEDRYRARSPSGVHSQDYEAPVTRLRDVSQQDLYEDRRRNSYFPSVSYHNVYNDQEHEFGYETKYGGARHREALYNKWKDYPCSPSPPPTGSSRQYHMSGPHHQSVKQPPPGHHHFLLRSPLYTGSSHQYRTSGPHSPPLSSTPRLHKTREKPVTIPKSTQGRGHSVHPVSRDEARTHAVPRGPGDSMHPGQGDHDHARMPEVPQGDPSRVVPVPHRNDGTGARPSKRKNGPVEESERVVKRQGGVEDAEEGVPQYKMRFCVNGQTSMMWYATALHRVENPSSAAKHIQYWDRDTKSWEWLPDKTTPVFATEGDVGRYSRTKEILGL